MNKYSINPKKSHHSYTDNSKIDSSKLIKEVDLKNTLMNDFFKFFKVDNSDSLAKKLAKIQHLYEIKCY